MRRRGRDAAYWWCGPSSGKRRRRAFEAPAVDDPLHEEAGLLDRMKRPQLGVGERPVEDAVVAAA
jgi:hypothetical protein